MIDTDRRIFKVARSRGCAPLSLTMPARNSSVRWAAIMPR